MFNFVRAEHVGWFGAGLSTAALGVAAVQLLAGAPLPGPRSLTVSTATPTAFATRTPFPSRTPYPTRTPRPPFPTPTPAVVAPDLLATVTVADPDRVVGAVATFAARAATALASPRPR